MVYITGEPFIGYYYRFILVIYLSLVLPFTACSTEIGYQRFHGVVRVDEWGRPLVFLFISHSTYNPLFF